MRVLFWFSNLFSKNKLNNLTAAKNELQLQETLHLIKNPINQADRDQKEKLVNFLSAIFFETEFTIIQARQLFKEHRTYVSLTNQNLINLLELFATITYDKRQKIYKIKSCSLEFKKSG